MKQRTNINGLVSSGPSVSSGLAKKLSALILAVSLTVTAAGCGNAVEYKSIGTPQTDSSSESSPEESSLPSDSSSLPSEPDSSPEVTAPPPDSSSIIDSLTVAEDDPEYLSKAAFVGEALCSGLSVYTNEIDESNVFAEINAHVTDISKTEWDINGKRYKLPDALYAAEKKYVYLWLGPNDLSNLAPAEFAQKYKELINEIFYANPMAYVGVISIAPVSSEYESKLTKGKISEYNTELSQMIDSIGNNRVTFFNITSTLADSSGNLLADYASSDGLHLKSAAYKAIAEYIQTNQIHPFTSDTEQQTPDSADTADTDEADENSSQAEESSSTQDGQ